MLFQKNGVLMYVEAMTESEVLDALRDRNWYLNKSGDNCIIAGHIGSESFTTIYFYTDPVTGRYQIGDGGLDKTHSVYISALIKQYLNLVNQKIGFENHIVEDNKMVNEITQANKLVEIVDCFKSFGWELKSREPATIKWENGTKGTVIFKYNFENKNWITIIDSVKSFSRTEKSVFLDYADWLSQNDHPERPLTAAEKDLKDAGIKRKKNFVSPSGYFQYEGDDFSMVLDDEGCYVQITPDNGVTVDLSIDQIAAIWNRMDELYDEVR